jgi:predicted nucleotidyltransferase
LKQQIEIKIIDFIRKEISDVISIYIFGSFAANQETPSSDLDIAYFASKKTDSVKKWEIQEELASLLDIDVDLVDLQDASVILRTEVIEKGKLIFKNDKYKTDYFEMTTYSMYADLNESRVDILNDYKTKYGRDFNK